MPVAMTMAGVTYALGYDQVGSQRIVADGVGNVVKRIDYDAFGNIIGDTNSSLTVPFGFAGGLYDRDTGLVRFGYRDFDPDTGRWTAKDPIGFAGGDTDLYGYVQNNPVNLIDPEGLFAPAVTAGLGALIGGAVNAAYAYSKGESALKGFLVGAGAGALAGLTMNPMALGAIVGVTTKAGNMITGIDDPCSPEQAALDLAKAAALGALAGKVGGLIGDTMPPGAEAMGEAVGAAALSSVAMESEKNRGRLVEYLGKATSVDTFISLY